MKSDARTTALLIFTLIITSNAADGIGINDQSLKLTRANYGLGKIPIDKICR